MIRRLIGGATLLMFAVCAGVTMFSPRHLVCGYPTVVKETLSPDGQHKAVVFLTQCGSATPPTPHVSVLENGQALQPDADGNVLVGARAHSRVEVIWQSGADLLVLHDAPEASLERRETDRLGVRIRYARLTP
jgi:hypothetical protein